MIEPIDSVKVLHECTIMADIQRDTREKVLGPFILTEASLEELQEIINSESKRLLAAKKKSQDGAARKLIHEYRGSAWFDGHDDTRRKEEEKSIRKRVEDSYEYSNDVTEWKVTLDSGDKVIGKSYEALKISQDVKNRRPTGLAVKVKIHQIEAKIEWGLSLFENASLVIDVTPPSNSHALDLFSKLTLWADKIRPNPIWRLMSFPSFLLWPILLFFWATLYQAAIYTDMSYRQQLRAEALEIVNSGVTKENEHQALRLILMFAGGAYPREGRTEVATWYWFFIGLSGVLALFLSAPIYPAVAIGSGGKSVARQLRLRKFLWQSLPLFLLTAILVPIGRSYVWDLIKSML